MTQQEQQEFRERLEDALSWMQVTQEQLRANDNTQGPRDALEARLKETEKIHSREHEGRVLVDMVLVAAEVLLQASNKDLSADTNAKLKDLKVQWEEISTDIIHCHSRIEWVWLHWNEYLKAHEEFEVWLARLRARLAAGVELQLGAREKLWQVDHQRVVLSDVCGQAPLLERLLDEAAALHGRTQDPSVEPTAQEALRQVYHDVRDGAKERLSLLQKMAEEHQMYLGCVDNFQTWLLSKTKELTELLERDDSPENRFHALQVLDSSVAGEEMTLRHVEGVAEAVQGNTSPAGAQQVAREAQELRQSWLRLRQDLSEAGEGLRASLDAHSQYLVRQQRLGQDIGRLQLLLQGLGRELEEGRGGAGAGGERADGNEEQLVGRWRKYTGVRNALISEEPQMEHLKAQLKDLFRFPEDSRHLSDDVLAVVKEHQSVKCRAVRLCSESESSLRQVLQDPLHFYTQWSEGVSQVLEASAEVTDFSHIAMLVQNIERLLKHSVQLEERLSLLQARADLLATVFGPQHAEGLGAELSAAAHNRDLLHTQLLQRKSQLQGVLSRTKQFGDAHEVIHCTLSELRDRLAVADVLQPDILTKKSKADQLGKESTYINTQIVVDATFNILDVVAKWPGSTRDPRILMGSGLRPYCLLFSSIYVRAHKNTRNRFHVLHGEIRLSPERESIVITVILKDLEDCDAHITALETLVSSSATNRTQFDRLFAEWKFLYKAVRVKVGESEDEIVEHEGFHEGLLSLEKWLMIMRQKLESFRGPSGDWSVEKRQPEAERALGEFPEKELQLHQTEARGLGVLEHTSKEGQVHILRDMKRLRESWMALHDLSLNLYRLLNSSTEELTPDLWRVDGLAGERKSALTIAPLPAGGEYTMALSRASSGEGSDEDAPRQSHNPWPRQVQSSARETNLKGLDDVDVGLRPHYDHVGRGARRVEEEGDGHDLGSWTEGGVKGGSSDAVGSSRSPGIALVTGLSMLSDTVGSTTTVTADRASDDLSPGASREYRRGQGSGTSSRRRAARAETPEGRRSGGPAAAEGLGQGRGAFTPFRRGAASPLQSSSSPQGPASMGAATASDLQEWNQSTTGSGGQAVSPAEYEARRREFEAWLLRQNELLSALLSTKGAKLGPKELKIRTDNLQVGASKSTFTF
ncbi:Nesprin-3 [Merluccius polli]|uniref:Nesprin-3 n=1 Tax=Merluccius polli TaxID=89951 RepID=A0AA47N0V2_MERPO|nr:Nesprin-3 [Merluccius polli]